MRMLQTSTRMAAQGSQFGAHSLKNLERNLLASAAASPRSRESILGGVEAMGRAKGRRWVERLERLGRNAA